MAVVALCTASCANFESDESARIQIYAATDETPVTARIGRWQDGQLRLSANDNGDSIGQGARIYRVSREDISGAMMWLTTVGEVSCPEGSVEMKRISSVTFYDHDGSLEVQFLDPDGTGGLQYRFELEAQAPYECVSSSAFGIVTTRGG